MSTVKRPTVEQLHEIVASLHMSMSTREVGEYLEVLEGTFQAYDLIAVMTGGGPGNATTTLSWYIYEQAFQASNAGRAAAAAMILFFILLAVTALQTTYSQRKVHYQ